jgi:3-hydroxybutyryl-CoA dehydrogenase
VDLVVESVVEDLAAKIDVLRRCAERFPDAILASNTSSLSITALGEGAGATERTIGTHYWNPPLLMPMVEVIKGQETAAATVERMTETLRALGKRPVLVEKDVPGFVWNRLQLALVREAAWIVEQGVATPETVDEIVRDGLARRWRLTGPFATMALGGPDTFARVAANLFPVLSDAESLDDLGRWLDRDPEALAAIRERRDAGLVAELRRERGEEESGSPPLK